jgi:hypothetical protein
MARALLRHHVTIFLPLNFFATLSSLLRGLFFGRAQSQVGWNKLRAVPAAQSFRVIQCRNCARLVQPTKIHYKNSQPLGGFFFGRTQSQVARNEA